MTNQEITNYSEERKEEDTLSDSTKESAQKTESLSSKLFYYIVLIIGLFTFSPFLAALLGALLDTLFKCGGSNMCEFGGSEMASFVFTLTALHWYALFTFPVGFILFVIVFIIRFVFGFFRK